MTDEQANLIPEDEAALRLVQAQQELDALTPQSYLDMVDHIRDLEDQIDMGKSGMEAGGVCWMDWYSSHGARINLTARATSPMLAAEKLISASRVLLGYGWTPATNARYEPRRTTAKVDETPPEPEYVEDQIDSPQEGSTDGGDDPIQVMEVTEMECDKTRAGVLYVRARGGFVTKYGVPAYEKVTQKIAGFDLKNYNFGDKISIPPEMRYMWVNTDRPMKVVAFSSDPDTPWK